MVNHLGLLTPNIFKNTFRQEHHLAEVTSALRRFANNARVIVDPSSNPPVSHAKLL